MTLRWLTAAVCVLCSTWGFQGSTWAQEIGQPHATAGTGNEQAMQGYSSAAQTAMGSEIGRLLRTPAVAGAHWGIAVTAIDGTPIFSLNEGQLFRPASTAKLFTTAAALGILGPSATVTTSVRFPPPAADGTVDGDISLVGRGDANLSGRRFPWRSAASNRAEAPLDPLHDFDSFAAAIAKAGVRRVTGGVSVRGAWDLYPAGWEQEDLLWGYGAPVSELSVNDNEIELQVKASRNPGELASVTTSPGLPFYHLDVQVTTANPSSTPAGVTVQHEAGDRTLHLVGSLAAGSRYTAEIAIDDPPRFAAEALRQALLAHGITVEGSVSATREMPLGVSFLHVARTPLPSPRSLQPEPLPAQLPVAFVTIDHLSPPLAEDITATLKESLNLHAELMLRSLGGGSAPEGARAVHQWLTDAGVSDHEFVFYDGSGLSTKDLVTPHAEAQLLAFATRQGWFPQWKAALPVGGVDGTLQARFPQPPLRGHVFAKTGTLGESRALAGYLVCASGREVIFSIMDDDHPPGSSADRTVMDAIVAAIAAAN